MVDMSGFAFAHFERNSCDLLKYVSKRTSHCTVLLSDEERTLAKSTKGLSKHTKEEITEIASKFLKEHSLPVSDEAPTTYELSVTLINRLEKTRGATHATLSFETTGTIRKTASGLRVTMSPPDLTVVTLVRKSI